MKYIVAFFLLFAGINDPITKIADANKLKREAQAAYESENYKQAVKAYIQLIDSLQVEDEVAQMNLANAAYMLGYGDGEFGKLDQLPPTSEGLDSSAMQTKEVDLQYANIAIDKYTELTEASKKHLASNAYNQLGVISVKKGEQSQKEQKAFMESALSQFKQALIKNSQNDNARYNYELLKKYLKQQEEQEQDDQNQDEKEKNEDQKDQEQQKDKEQQEQDQKDQQKQDEQKKDQQEEKQENGEQKEDQDGEQQEQEPQEQEQGEQEEDPLEKLKEKLKEMNIPLEKAKMILEAMKNQEVQYVQQMKRKASKPQKSTEKDW